MKVRNNSVRVIFFGDVAVIPGTSEVIADEWVNNPVLSDYIASGDAEVMDSKPAKEAAKPSK